MILVMGASGNVGSELVKRLHSAGANFRAAYHAGPGAEAKLAQPKAAGIDAVVCEYRDRQSLTRAMQGVRKLFLACPASAELPELEGRVIEEAKRAGIKFILKISVWDAQTEAFELARIHRQSEKLIENSGFAYSFLRPNSYMQNMTNYFAASIRNTGSFSIPARHSRCSHVDVRDVASVAAKILVESSAGYEGKSFTLSGPEGLSYEQIAQKISRLVGRNVFYNEISDEEYSSMARSYGASDWLIRAMIELYHYSIAGHASRVTPAVEQVIGREPLSFDQFADDYADQFRPTAAKVA